MVAQEVLQRIESAKLRIYSVWEPILRTDDERAARKATALLDDPRVEHYWTRTRDVGRAFQAPIDLKGEPAWDVYLVYPPGISWKESIPRPDYFMHQLRGRLADSNRLDGEKLAERIESLLFSTARY